MLAGVFRSAQRERMISLELKTVAEFHFVAFVLLVTLFRLLCCFFGATSFRFSYLSAVTLELRKVDVDEPSSQCNV